MKYFLSLIAWLFIGNISFAYDFAVDGFYYNIKSLKELTVSLTFNDKNTTTNVYGETKYLPTYSGNITVPNIVKWNGKTFKVEEVLGNAFQGCEISTLTVPTSVTFLKIDGAIIKKMIVEDGEEAIHSAFFTTEEPFYNDSYGITRNTVIDELYLGRPTPSRFSGAGIKKVTFGNSVNYISSYSFSGCDITGTLNFPNSITQIGDNGFSSNSNLENVVGANVSKIELQSFSDCENLKTVNMPNLTYIGSGAFENCTSLKQFDIPNGVLCVGSVAFAGCKSLEKVSIPQSIVNFGNMVYYNVTYNQVFRDCNSLKDIVVRAKTPFVMDESNFESLTYFNSTLHIPANCLESYQNTEVWKNFSNIVEDAPTDGTFSILIKSWFEGSWFDGKISAEGKELTQVRMGMDVYNYAYGCVAKLGEKVTLKFETNQFDGYYYEVSSVLVNGKDMTNDIYENTLNIEVTQNLNIEVEWEEREENPKLLTIRQAENGCTKMVVNEWDTYRFYIEPSNGWRLHSVSFSGLDITSSVGTDGYISIKDITENSTLDIAFELESTGVKTMQTSKVKIYGDKDCIIVRGANYGDEVKIYNEAGAAVATKTIYNDTVTIPVTNNHVYIVKASGKTVKIAI